MDLRELLEKQSLGPIEMEVNEGEIVTDLVVIGRLQTLGDTDDQVTISTTEHTGGVLAHGIISSGLILHTQWMTQGKDEEGEE